MQIQLPSMGCKKASGIVSNLCLLTLVFQPANIRLINL